MDNLVYTNDNCQGCNRCISVCPVLTANSAVNEDGENKVKVDSSKCIACGSCIDTCEHDAREYEDDTEQFFKDLKSGQTISVLFETSLFVNYNT